MFKTIHRIIAKTVGFTIIGNGYKHRHYTLSFKEAVSWAACYGDGASIYRRGTWVAAKLSVAAE